MITDPPYGLTWLGFGGGVDSAARQRGARTYVRADGSRSSNAPRKAGPARIEGDSDTRIRDYAIRVWGSKPALIFGSWRIPRPAATRQLLIWDKTDGTGPRLALSSAFATTHEEIYVLGSWPPVEGVPRLPSVLRTSTLMGSGAGLAARIGHPTPKPVGLLERLIEAAPPGLIVDPFVGSGSTLIAARNLGRHAIGIELDPTYADLAANRLCELPLPLHAL